GEGRPRSRSERGRGGVMLTPPPHPGLHLAALDATRPSPCRGGWSGRRLCHLQSAPGRINQALGCGGTRVTETMKALLLRRHGDLQDLEVVSDYPVPQATDGHVVIRVKASSFNYHDVFTMRGMPGIKVPLPVIVGLDMAGEISQVGGGVAGWKVGDRVL